MLKNVPVGALEEEGEEEEKPPIDLQLALLLKMENRSQENSIHTLALIITQKVRL